MTEQVPHGGSTKPFQFRLRTLFVAMGAVGVLCATNCLGLVEIHYPRVVDNDPLLSPVRVTAINGGTFELEDGRILRVDDFMAKDIEQVIAQGGYRIDMELNGQKHQVDIFTKHRGWLCGTPWAGGLIQIPLIADDVPINSRRWVGSATIEYCDEEPTFAVSRSHAVRKVMRPISICSSSLCLLALHAHASAVEPAIQTSTGGAFARAVELAQQRTVKVYGAGIGRSPGYASGVIVGPAGEILTAQGVFLAAGNLRVTLPDGTTHFATVTRRSNELQAALLKIDAETPEYFDLSEPVEVQTGDWILAVSNAFKVADGPEPLSVNVGVLSLRMRIDARRGVQDFPYEADAWLYDAITSNPGADGGAVVSADGRLVGMIGRVIESKSTGTRLNYAVPADLLAAFMKGDQSPLATTTTTSAEKADLGIRLFALGGRRAPAYIDRVIPGSPAAVAGLKSDDLVVAIGGQIVRDAADFRRLAEALPVGQEVVIEVKRKNELLSVRLTPVADN